MKNLAEEIRKYQSIYAWCNAYSPMRCDLELVKHLSTIIADGWFLHRCVCNRTRRQQPHNNRRR